MAPRANFSGPNSVANTKTRINPPPRLDAKFQPGNQQIRSSSAQLNPLTQPDVTVQLDRPAFAWENEVQ